MIAEAKGRLKGLKLCDEHGTCRADIESDTQKQIQGPWVINYQGEAYQHVN